jgi:glyoxylase-like metal-dependent hydrolase (beta-lactamase superfamily II)
MKIHPIDLHFQGTPGIIAAWLVQSANQCALIDVGPGSCHATLLEGLRSHGVSPSDVRQVLLTHIHLDHAGGAGWWAQQGAQVFVHARGAPHVVDPSRLIDSAARIYGGEMERLWGAILPAPGANVTALNEGDRVVVGDAEIIAWDTPGHARHHHAFVLGDSCFTGDVAGVRMAGCDYLSVAAAPPQFEPEPYVASVRRLLAANFQRLYLAHFGEVADPATHLEGYAQRIKEVYEQVAAWKAEGISSDQIAHRYTAVENERASAAGVSSASWERYQKANGTVMCAQGVELFLARHA